MDHFWYRCTGTGTRAGRGGGGGEGGWRLQNLPYFVGNNPTLLAKRQTHARWRTHSRQVSGRMCSSPRMRLPFCQQRRVITQLSSTDFVLVLIAQVLNQSVPMYQNKKTAKIKQINWQPWPVFQKYIRFFFSNFIFKLKKSKLFLYS